MLKPVYTSYSQVRLKSNGNLKVYVIYFATVIASSSVSLKVLFRNCIFWVQIKMISSSCEANPKCTQQLSCTRIHVKKTSHGQASVNASFCQKWPSSTYFHCRLRQCERPLETFNRLFTLLRVIPEQRKVDVFSSYWTDGYDQNVWQVVKIHMKLKKSCVD